MNCIFRKAGGRILKVKKYIESKEVYEGMTFVHIENKAFADGGTSLRVFQKEGTSIPLFAQKEVLHVPAQLWKQEDLEFMTFQKKDVD